MGKMSPSGADVLLIEQKSDGYQGKPDLHRTCYQERNALDALDDFKEPPANTGYRNTQKRWIGEVFFDHIRGVLDRTPEPIPGVDPPFLLVLYTKMFDYPGIDGIELEEFSSASELIARAEALIAKERSSGGFTWELWEVYGVRIQQFRDFEV